MACYPAPACRAALSEALRKWPNRSVASDGICASPRHTQQNPNSDHEVGNAWDLTHDPANGCDAHLLVEQLVARHDKRIKYAISQGRIARSYNKPGIAAWTWSKYTGSNDHTKHAHVSIHADARNDTSPWFGASPQPKEVDELTAEESKWLSTIHHELRHPDSDFNKNMKMLREVHQHLEVLMHGVPAMSIPPVPQTIFQIAEKHGIDT